jgi:hypothetical protein
MTARFKLARSSASYASESESFKLHWAPFGWRQLQTYQNVCLLVVTRSYLKNMLCVWI